MTVQFLAAWNGYEQYQVVALAAAEEARLIAAGVCRNYVAGVDGRSLAAVVQDPVSRVQFAGADSVSVTANGPLPAIGFPLASGIDANSGCTASNAALTYVTRLAPNGQVLRGVRMTSNGGATTNCSIDIPFSVASTIPNQRISYLVYIDQGTAAIARGLTIYLADATFANYFQRNTTVARQGWWTLSPTQTTATQPTVEKWNVGGGAPVFGTTSFSKTRLRYDYNAGEAPIVEVYAVVEDGGISPAPLCFTFDDGYISQYTMAAPTLERYGLRGSFAVIADLIGSNPANFMSWDQLRDLRDRGHEINVHGPIGGGGSLLNYAGSADRFAAVLNDLNYHRNAVIAAGLNVNGSANCYVYPQGNNAFSNGDDTIMRALSAAGFKLARGVNNTRDDFFGPWGDTYYAQYLSIVGHAWADEASEPANITRIQQRLADNTNARRPSVLMFHYVVPSAQAPVQALEIRQSNLELICQTAANQVKAGTAQNVTMTGLYRSITGRYPN
jgi:hypothetical protein